MGMAGLCGQDAVAFGSGKDSQPGSIVRSTRRRSKGLREQPGFRNAGHPEHGRGPVARRLNSENPMRRREPPGGVFFLRPPGKCGVGYRRNFRVAKVSKDTVLKGTVPGTASMARTSKAPLYSTKPGRGAAGEQNLAIMFCERIVTRYGGPLDDRASGGSIAGTYPCRACQPAGRPKEHA